MFQDPFTIPLLSLTIPIQKSGGPRIDAYATY